MPEANSRHTLLYGVEWSTPPASHCLPSWKRRFLISSLLVMEPASPGPGTEASAAGVVVGREDRGPHWSTEGRTLMIPRYTRPVMEKIWNEEMNGRQCLM